VGWVFQCLLSFDNSGLSLLEKIKPVREQFDTKSMDLDDIVQRDIDDARVTGELIPYLLNKEGIQQPFRMFPNIIVNLVPVDKARNLLPHHDPVTNGISEKNSDSAKVVNAQHDVRLIYSGALGSGDFCAQWPVRIDASCPSEASEEFRHVGELLINTATSELIVVDGQHRAMSLIALYRNITNSWDTSGSRGNKYRQYYEYIWPGSSLDPDSLSEISLPVTICLYPDLSNGNPIAEEINFTQALRRNFTTLNSPAVPITRERKILLSETDLVSTCMRALSRNMVDYSFKSGDNLHYSMYNLELDKKKDQAAIVNKVCSFGVSSLHKLCELMLLSGVGEYKKALDDSGNYGRRSLLDETNFSSRLLLNDIFSPDDMPKSRFNFTKLQGQKVSDQFIATYAQFASKILLEFLPMEYHHAACSEVEIDLTGDQSNRLQSILFDGQGQQEVIKEFQKMISNPTQAFAEPMRNARFKECKIAVDRDTESIIAQHKLIAVKRSKMLLARISTLPASYVQSFPEEDLLELTSFLWEKKYKSVAFQSALVLTPQILIESFDSSSGQRMGDLFADLNYVLVGDLTTSDIVSDYVEAINTYFAPTTKTGFRNLLTLFNGQPVAETFVNDDIKTWSFKSDSRGPRFGTVVAKSMDPKFWCAYRYILLEIYSSLSKLVNHNSSTSSEGINALRETLRNQVRLLRTSLIRRVYFDIYKQNSESPDITAADLVPQSIDGARRRINVILSACRVPSDRHITNSDIRTVLDEKRDDSSLDLDSINIDEEEGADY